MSTVSTHNIDSNAKLLLDTRYTGSVCRWRVGAEDDPHFMGLCIWDTDENKKRACTFDYAYNIDGVSFCMACGNDAYEIAYEVLFECEDNEECTAFERKQYSFQNVKIKVCKVDEDPPLCTIKTERQWKYFSWGNFLPKYRNDGIGNIYGRDWVPGVYEVTGELAFVWPYSGAEVERRGGTVRVHLLDDCDDPNAIPLPCD